MSDEIKENKTSGCWPADKDAGGHQSISTTAFVIEGRNNTEHCMVCGSALQYLDQAQGVTCSYCGKAEHGHIKCPNGHYICETCHSRDAMQIIEDIALTTTSKDPFETADLMMNYPGLPMLGCQHAYIAGGAFMAAISNEEMKEVFTRTQKQAHGGYCGLSGVCGIAPAIGACFAVLTGSKCGMDQAQRITMEAVTRITRAITDLTGPSCCKAYVWTSLETAINYLKESLGIALPSRQAIACDFSTRHPHGCREARCPYYKRDAQRKITRHCKRNCRMRYTSIHCVERRSGHG